MEEEYKKALLEIEKILSVNEQDQNKIDLALAIEQDNALIEIWNIIQNIFTKIK